VRLAAVLVVACLIVFGCDQGLTRGIYAENRTSTPLRFAVILADGDLHSIPGDVQPGDRIDLQPDFGSESVATKDGCTVGDVIAYDADGTEVARRHPPFCFGDEVWVIAPNASPSTASSRAGPTIYDRLVTFAHAD
jgi:hypothetical protein